MSIKHDVIDVSVSEQILWIGSGAYPLRAITRVGYGKWKPRRWFIGWTFVKFVVKWSFIGFLVTAALHALLKEVAPSFSPDPKPLLLLLAASLVALIAFRATSLFRGYWRTFYQLDIETAGSSITAVASKDENVVRHLAELITNAINNPAAKFHLKVENFHVGDNITQHGPGSQVHK